MKMLWYVPGTIEHLYNKTTKWLRETNMPTHKYMTTQRHTHKVLLKQYKIFDKNVSNS